MPSRLMRLSAAQPTLASVFWAGRVRARRPRPMMALYLDMAVSPSDRLPFVNGLLILLCHKSDKAEVGVGMAAYRCWQHGQRGS